jgi:hypothetical protein
VALEPRVELPSLQE